MRNAVVWPQMKATGEYRLLKVIVAAVPTAPIAPDEWLRAARRGIADATFAAGSTDTWWVKRFFGTCVDTDESSAWAAGAMATLDALEVDASLAFENGWRITLASGVTLRFEAS